MTDKNIQIKDLEGNNLFPKTKASVVFNNSNQNLGTVEAGAEVNVIESISVNGTPLTVTNKGVNITIDSESNYSVTKQTTAESGYAATYYLTKDGTQVGAKINIPKDMVVQSGSVETVATANTPVSGYQVGDKYIDLVLANASNSHIYILVSDLIDVYTEGNGINISSNSISVDTSDTTIVDTAPTNNSTKFVQSGGVYTALSGKANSSHTHKSSDITSMTSYAKAASVAAILTSDSLNVAIGKLEKALDSKANSATTLSGYGITDALTYEVLT